MGETVNVDALVIRCIGEIEHGLKHAIDVVGPRLWQVVGCAVLRHLDGGEWRAWAAGEEEDVGFGLDEWRAEDDQQRSFDYGLVLNEHTGAGGDGENSWLASFVGAGPNGASMALFFFEKPMGAKPWKALLKAQGELVDRLVAAGFHHDAKRGELFIPIVLDREALAEAFESEDFDAALQPLLAAIDVAVGARASLGSLVAAVRCAA